MDRVSVTIIGGGVIGCAIAQELSKTAVRDILLIERNPKIEGDNQSSRNSGVIHAGIYYSRITEPLKARFCVEGNRLLYEFCEEFGVPHRRTGKLVVAVDDLEEEFLDEVRTDAVDNGVRGFRVLDGRQVTELEPSVRGSKALYFPTTGLVEPTELVSTLHHQAQGRGVIFLPGNRVVHIAPHKSGFKVVTQSKDGTETFATELLINAAGLYSDEISRLVNPDSPYQILPIRGEWAKFTKDCRPELSLSEMSVYPAPYGADNMTGERVRMPYAEYRRFLEQGRVTKSVGIHLSPTFGRTGGEYVIGRTVIVGPTYVVGVDKEDYSAKHPEPYYLDKVRSFFPGLRTEDLELHQTGIRAKLKGRSDFVIERDAKHPNCINLAGIDSPGLTASLAIARYVRDMIRD